MISRKRKLTDLHPLPEPERLPSGHVRCLICGKVCYPKPNGQPRHHREGCGWSMRIADIGTPRARWEPRSKQPTPMTRWRVWQGGGRVRCVLTGWLDELAARRFAAEVNGTIEEAAALRDSGGGR